MALMQANSESELPRNRAALKFKGADVLLLLHRLPRRSPYDSSLMGTWFRKVVASALLAATGFAAFLLLHQSDNSLKEMFPALAAAKETGQLPDGLVVRRTYTGHEVVDDVLTGLAACFGLLVDGRDEATYRFALWFLPQLSPLVVHMYWESGRRRSPFMRLYVSCHVPL